MTASILLTGATGYIGGRLLKLLESENRPVRCIARQPEFLRGRVSSGIEVVAGDLLDVDSIDRAMTGVHTAYYLVHSMGTAHYLSENPFSADRAKIRSVRKEIAGSL